MSATKKTQKASNAVNNATIPAGRFNPYTLIDSNDYGPGAQSRAQYEEDLAMLQYYADLHNQDWMNEYNRQQLEDERAYNERMRDEDRAYNSPANQARLMRQAGINPDLNGVDFTSSSSSDSPTSQPSAPSPSGGNNISAGFSAGSSHSQMIGGLISQVGSLASNLFTGGFGALSSAMNFRNSSTQLASAIAELGINFTQGIPDAMVEPVINSLGLPRSVSKRVMQVYRDTQGSRKVSNAGFKFENDFMQNQSDFWHKVSSPIFNPQDINNDGGFDNKDWLAVWKPITDLEYDLMKSSLKSSHNKNLMDMDAFELKKTMREPLLKVIQNLKKKSDSGKDWATYALIALYGVLNSSFSYSSQNTPKGKNSGFNFGF